MDSLAENDKLQNILNISQDEHRVKNIDCLTHVGDNLIIWSLATRSLTIMAGKKFCCVVPIGSELDCFSIPVLGEKVQLILKVKFKQQQQQQQKQIKDDNQNVFMVRQN